MWEILVYIFMMMLTYYISLWATGMMNEYKSESKAFCIMPAIIWPIALPAGILMILAINIPILIFMLTHLGKSSADILISSDSFDTQMNKLYNLYKSALLEISTELKGIFTSSKERNKK